MLSQADGDELSFTRHIFMWSTRLMIIVYALQNSPFCNTTTCFWKMFWRMIEGITIFSSVSQYFLKKNRIIGYKAENIFHKFEKRSADSIVTDKGRVVFYRLYFFVIFVICQMLLCHCFCAQDHSISAFISKMKHAEAENALLEVRRWNYAVKKLREE